MPCRPMRLSVSPVRQKNLCGCGLAALEIVLGYYGANDTQIDFLADRRVKRLVECSTIGLSEGMLGTLALKRGFRVVIYGEKPRLTKTFLQMGGKVKHVRTGKRLIFSCLRRSVPPIVLIPRVSDAYERQREEIGHYVVIDGRDHNCELHVVDPQYDEGPKQDYWNSWSSSLIAIKPILRVDRYERFSGSRE